MDCENCIKLKELEKAIISVYLENKKLRRAIAKYKKKSKRDVGRPSLSDYDIFNFHRLRRCGYSYREISDMTNFSKSVIFKYCKSVLSEDDSLKTGCNSFGDLFRNQEEIDK